MKALARDTSTEQCPPGMSGYAKGPLHVTRGTEYDVHAMAVFDGIVVLQIVDDANWPAWIPAWYFDVTDRTLPDDWTSNTFRDSPLTLVVGPEFVSSSESSYSQMVELEGEPFEQFWSRVRSQQN